jgi:hypothetical protein
MKSCKNSARSNIGLLHIRNLLLYLRVLSAQGRVVFSKVITKDVFIRLVVIHRRLNLKLPALSFTSVQPTIKGAFRLLRASFALVCIAYIFAGLSTVDRLHLKLILAVLSRTSLSNAETIQFGPS